MKTQKTQNYDLRNQRSPTIWVNIYFITFLTKDAYLCKPVKPDLALELKKMIKENMPEELPEAVVK